MSYVIFIFLSSLHIAEFNHLSLCSYRAHTHTPVFLCLFSGPMCILLQETVTTEKLTLRCSFGKEGFLIYFFFFLSICCPILFLSTNNSCGSYQDCAGVILCAAERATQVALQVKKLYTTTILMPCLLGKFLSKYGNLCM